LLHPLADVSRATPEFDAFAFGLCQKLHSIKANQLYLGELDGGDSAFVESGAKDLEIFRREPAADVKDQTLFRRKSVDSARHWLALPVVDSIANRAPFECD
jgi:hypothetical protein